MKKIFLLIILISSPLIAEEKSLKEDVRKYHQPMEEKVFELEGGEKQAEKINEAFLMGKKRVEDFRKNQVGTEFEEEAIELERKYNKILEKYEKNLKEKEILLLENEKYEKQLKKTEK